jgi:hypothetical protein
MSFTLENIRKYAISLQRMAKNEEIMKRAKSSEAAFQVHYDSKSHCVNVVDYKM